MRTQRRPFLVEVKRGTTRSAFTVKDTVPEIIRKAEAVLFRHAQPQPQSRQIMSRILPSIVEDLPSPAPLAPESYGPPKRRGRPIGSKKKPKPVPQSTLAEEPSAAAAEAFRGYLRDTEAPLARKRRGRPPGSQNKPKGAPAQPTIPKKVRLALKEAGVDLDSGDIRPTPDPVAIPSIATTVPQGAPDQQQAPTPPVQKRTRLRDRSKILSRYVYGSQSVPRIGRSRR